MYTGEARLAKNIASIYLQNLYSKKDLIKVLFPIYSFMYELC